MELNHVSSNFKAVLKTAVHRNGGMSMVIKKGKEWNFPFVPLEFEFWNMRSAKPVLDRSITVAFSYSRAIQNESGRPYPIIYEGTAIEPDEDGTKIPIHIFNDVHIVLIGDRLVPFGGAAQAFQHTVLPAITDFDKRSLPVQWLITGERHLFLAMAEDVCREDMENVDDASWADTGFSTSVPSPSKLLETEASCVCNSCFQAYPQSIFYHCNICCAQDGGRYVCSLCLRKAIWCGDRSHILTAVSKPTSTLRWRPSHHLVVIPQAHGEPEPERLFYERLDAVVASEPHLVPRTTQLIWFLNEALVLIYDYETKHRTICSIYNHAPWDSISDIFVSASRDLVFVVGIGRPISEDLNDSLCFPVWALQYSRTDLQQDGTVRPIHAEVIQIEGIRRCSKPSVTMLVVCSWITTIQDDGTVQTQVIHCLDFKNKRREFMRRSLQPRFCLEEWPSIPSYEEMPSVKGPCHTFPTTSTGLSSFTKVQYFPTGLEAEPASLVMHSPLGQNSSITMVAVDGIDTFWQPMMERMDKREFPRNLVVSQDELERAAPQSQEVSDVGALCEMCHSALEESELLQESSFWRERSLAQMAMPEFRDGCVQTRDYSQLPPHRHNNGVNGDEKEIGAPTRYETNEMSEVAFRDAKIPLYEPRYEHFQHHSSWESFASSIISGCHLCTMFQNQIRPRTQFEATIKSKMGELHVFTAEDPSSEQARADSLAPRLAGSSLAGRARRLKGVPECKWLRKSIVASENRSEDGEFVLCISSEPGSNPYERGHITLYLPADRERDNPKWTCSVPLGRLLDIYNENENPPSPITGDPPRQSRPKFTSSIETIALARSWLAECITGHACAVRDPQARPPTRLIDTRPPAGPYDLRLLITNGRDVGLEYLTLSHCWGRKGRASALLTKNNLQQFTTGFSINDLPATFRDAIRTCRALNHRYIWIDSLCIVQDDPEDWSAEAARMANVYEGSLCNLAATSSSSVESGLFTLRREYEFSNLRWKNCQGTTFMFKAPMVAEYPAPLHHRGWVFQETLLSPRTIEFSTAGIHWECRIRRANDYWTIVIPRSQGLATDVDKKPLLEQAKLPQLRAHGADAVTASRLFNKTWFEIVERYCQLSLSVRTDRLTAIVGVSSAIRQATGLDFFFGLWNNSCSPYMLLSQLLWTSLSPEELEDGEGLCRRETRRQDLQIPSFSWASMDDESMIEHRITFHERVINDTTTLNVSRRSCFMRCPHSFDGDESIYDEHIHYGKNTLRGRSANPTLPGNDPFAVHELEFPANIKQLCSAWKLPGTEARRVPALIIEAPARDVKLQLLYAFGEPGEHYEKWRYPWPRPEYNDGHNRKTGDIVVNKYFDFWFFPDGPFVPKGTTVKCVTIASWKRGWDNRYYVAGLVLHCRFVPEHGGEDTPPTYERIGYFEHSWESKHSEWRDQGHRDTFVII